MKSRKRNQDLHELCGQVHSDDGLDPREAYWNRPRSRKKDDRRARPLCKQVFRLLTLAFAGECREPVLRDLDVVGVEPAPDATRLLVFVTVKSPNSGWSAEEIVARLEGICGHLRGEIAVGVTRKRVPELGFRVVPVEEGRA